MNLNREQFLRAVERGKALLKELKKDYPELNLKPVFSRFGPRSGQCDLTTDLRKILSEFPEMVTVSDENCTPNQPIYCGDVLIEYRPENLKYESLRRLQQDARLPPGLNTVGNIRVIAGSLELLNGRE
ncbi:MAG: hypothetical protein WC701_08150 [Kiritimatiellales bacterium]